MCYLVFLYSPLSLPPLYLPSFSPLFFPSFLPFPPPFLLSHSSLLLLLPSFLSLHPPSFPSNEPYKLERYQVIPTTLYNTYTNSGGLNKGHLFYPYRGCPTEVKCISNSGCLGPRKMCFYCNFEGFFYCVFINFEGFVFY